MPSVGTVPAVVGFCAIALYDPKDGRISHMHHVLTLEGAAQYGADHHERNARLYAEKLGHKVSGLRALHVPNHQPSRSRLRVDVKKQVLVEIPTITKPALRAKKQVVTGKAINKKAKKRSRAKA
jgi:hypothetical protein